MAEHARRSEASVRRNVVQVSSPRHVRPRPDVAGCDGQDVPVLRRLRELIGLIRAFRCGTDGVATAAAVTEPVLKHAGIQAEDVQDLLSCGLVEAAEPLEINPGPREYRLNSTQDAEVWRSPWTARVQLSAAGAALLRRTSLLLASTIRTDSWCSPLPRWDRESRELWFKNVLVKRLRVDAWNQEPILTAFEEQGWPALIDDPLPPRPGLLSNVRLHDAINSLNRRMKNPLIQFGSGGGGCRIRWTICIS